MWITITHIQTILYIYCMYQIINPLIHVRQSNSDTLCYTSRTYCYCICKTKLFYKLHRCTYRTLLKGIHQSDQNSQIQYHKKHDIKKIKHYKTWRSRDMKNWRNFDSNLCSSSVLKLAFMLKLSFVHPVLLNCL